MRKFVVSSLLLFAMAVIGLAQSNTGNLTVNVSDASGVIPGATVVVKDEQTGSERTYTTGNGGSISVAQLDAGTFTITVSAPGRKTSVTTGVKIDIAQTTVRNVTLEPGEVTEVVEVVAGTEVINSANAELSNTVGTRQIQDLPLNGRNPLALIALQSGTSANGATNTVINGQRTSFTNITRDGLNIQDNFIRANATDFVPDRPNTDDVGEFTITTQNAGVEAGYGASQVQLVTPRGSNRFTGAGFIYNRNSKFGANDFFRNRLGQANPFLNRNQFGGRLGGPIIKNKLFFFGSYEGFRLRQSTNVNSTVLRPSARAGIFTYRDTSNVVRTLNLFTAAQGPNPGTVTGIDPLIQSRFLANMPAGNNESIGDGLNTIGYSFTKKQDQDREAVTLRFDYDMNSQNSINGVWSWRDEFLLRPDVDNGGFNNTPFGFQVAKTWTTNVAWRYTPSSSLTNELRVANQLSRPQFDRNNQASDYFVTLPVVTSPESTFQTQGRNTSTWLVSDNAVYTWGDHSIRFGGQIAWYRINPYGPGAFGASTIPTITIGTNTTTPSIQNNTTNFPTGTLSAAQLGTANGMLALLGGIVSANTQTFNVTSQTSGFVPNTLPNRRLHYENYSWYIGDSWRVNQQLTLNFGLRHEIFTPVSEPDGLALEPVIGSNADIVAAVLNPAGTYNFVGTNNGDNRFFGADKDNFAPNVSFAWAPSFGGALGKLFPGEGKTVFRGGFSINYVNDEFVRSADNALIGNQGLSAARTITNQNGRLSTFNATLAAPTFQVPRTYAQNNALAALQGTVFAIDPDMKTPSLYQWTVGIQRELPWKTAVELRYVGNRSTNLIRGFDYNQVIIGQNGFAADFNRAYSNDRLCQAANQTTPGSCTTGAAFNAAITGSQVLTVFPNLGGGGLLTNATILSQIRAGTPGDLAITYLINGLAGTVQLVANPNAFVADVLTNGAESNYHSAQLEFRRRFANGFYMQANYTFAKALTDAAGVGQTRFDPLIDNAQQRLEYAVADFDTRHTFNFNAIYELPFGKGKRWANQGGILDYIIGGWQMTGIVRWSSGAPITFTDPRGTLNRAGRSGRQTANSSLNHEQIAALIGIFRTPCGVYWINPSVTNINQNALNAGQCSNLGLGNAANGFGSTPFSGQVFTNVAPGTTGALPRNAWRGPTFFNIDASLFKNFRITERVRFQVRGEAFNLTNRANFFAGLFNGNINSTTFGRVTTTFGPRIFQFVGRVEF